MEGSTFCPYWNAYSGHEFLFACGASPKLISNSITSDYRTHFTAKEVCLEGRRSFGVTLRAPGPVTIASVKLQQIQEG